jgi:uncharacterized membrane protein
MSFADLMGRLSDSISQIKVKSVIDLPLKVLLVIILLALISAWINVSMWITIVIFSFGGLVLLLFVFAYLYFAFNKPDYLRSESFQLRMRTLEVLGDKDGGLLPANPKDIILTSSKVSDIESEKEDEQ